MLYNAVVFTCEMKLFRNYFSHASTFVWNFYLSAWWKLGWNYFRIISQAYCSSWIFFNTFLVV